MSEFWFDMDIFVIFYDSMNRSTYGGTHRDSPLLSHASLRDFGMGQTIGTEVYMVGLIETVPCHPIWWDS